MAKFKEQSWHLPTGSDKNHEKLQLAITLIQATRQLSYLPCTMKMNSIKTQVVTSEI